MISSVPSSHPPKLQFFHYLIKPILRLKLREDSPVTILFSTVTYTTPTLQDTHCLHTCPASSFTDGVSCAIE